MPMGLTNAPATFQHFMNDIFQDMSNLFVIVYLDDILVFSNSVEEHRDHVRWVLSRLRENNLHVKPEKSLFHTHSIEFLGFMVSPSGVSMDVAKTDAITKWSTPSNIKQVQSFLGFTNFYRRFIVNFSDTAIPLTRLTRKDHKFAWGSKQQAAFEKLKLAFTRCQSSLTSIPLILLSSRLTPPTMPWQLLFPRLPLMMAICTRSHSAHGAWHQPNSTMKSMTKSSWQFFQLFDSGTTISRARLTLSWFFPTTGTLSILRPPSNLPDAKSDGLSTSPVLITSSGTTQGIWARSQMPSPDGRTSIRGVKMLMHSLTRTTSSLCSNLVNFCRPSSSTRPLSLFR